MSLHNFIEHSVQCLVYGELVICCCTANDSTTLWLKATDIYFLTVALGQESGLSLPGSSGSGSLIRLKSRCLLEPQSSLISPGVDPLSNSLSWLLAGFSSSWAAAMVAIQWLPHRHLHMAAPNMAAHFLQGNNTQEGKRENVSKREITFFHSQVLVLHPNTFSEFCLLEASYQVQPTLKGRGFTSGHKYWVGEKVTGTNLKAGYSTKERSIHYILVKCLMNE